MISASVPENDRVLNLLLSKGADVNAKRDTAVALIKEGADFTIKNTEDAVAIDLAPDKEVRNYVIQGAEREGIELVQT